jgi:hypothetical protein
MPIFKPFAAAAPLSRSVSAATAYQAQNPQMTNIVNITLNSSATLSLSGGTTNTANVVIGPTNAVASGTGTVIATYSNSNTGSLSIGLNLATVAETPISFILPATWYYAVIVTSGTVTIPITFEQVLG